MFVGGYVMNNIHIIYYCLEISDTFSFSIQSQVKLLKSSIYHFVYYCVSNKVHIQVKKSKFMSNAKQNIHKCYAKQNIQVQCKVG